MAETGPGQIRKIFGDNVARVRGLRHLTVRDLSARLEGFGLRLSASGVSEVEKATRKVSVDELVIIAIALNTSVIDLLTPSDGEPVTPAKGIEALSGQELELWLEGQTPWPGSWSDVGATDWEAFLDAVPQSRQHLQRRNLRPEIQAIDVLRDRVRKTVEVVEDPVIRKLAEDPKSDLYMRPEAAAGLMRDGLEDVTSYVTLLANQIEKNGYGKQIRKTVDGR